MFRSLTGYDQVTGVCIEVSSAVNQRPGASGASPALLLFGQRLKLYGKLYADGEPTGHHPVAEDLGDVLALRIRSAAQQALEIYSSRELVRRSVAARTRTLDKVSVGDMVLFY